MGHYRLLDCSSLNRQAVHAGFNQKLNNQVAKSQHPKYPGGRIKYLHTKEIDSFHNVSGGGAHSKVRVTRMKDTGELKKPHPSIVKSRIADMNIFSPKRSFDYRISISIEEPGESQQCGRRALG